MTRAVPFISWVLTTTRTILLFLFVANNNSNVTGECIRGPAVIKGNKFFDSISGNYLPIQGLAYYPRPNEGELSVSNSVDFFTDEYASLWEKDILNFQALGINTIRIYGVNPSLNHDAFMCALNRAGIYVEIGLLADCQDCGIGPDGPPSCYPTSLKTRGQYIIQVFSRYQNVLAFSAGNEVAVYATNKTTALNAPCQKQFLRDMRSYIASCSSSNNNNNNGTVGTMRPIPVGVVTADFDRSLNAYYYSCRTDPNDIYENADWYGINAYLHCNGDAVSIEELDGFIELREDFTDYNLNIPVLVTEYGCRARNFPTIDGFEAQRTWLQVDALFSESYANVFAGAIAFEYSAEKVIVDTSSQNNSWPYYGFMKLQYGIGYYAPIDCNHGSIPCEYNRYPEFELFANKLASIQNNTYNVPVLNDYDPPEIPLPDCPNEILPLSSFTWPTASQADWWCPAPGTFACPAGCGDDNGPVATPTSAPTSSTLMPTTLGAPMTSPPSTDAGTATPTDAATTMAPVTATPTDEPSTVAPTTEVPTLEATSDPTFEPGTPTSSSTSGTRLSVSLLACLLPALLSWLL